MYLKQTTSSSLSAGTNRAQVSCGFALCMIDFYRLRTSTSLSSQLGHFVVFPSCRVSGGKRTRQHWWELWCPPPSLIPTLRSPLGWSRAVSPLTQFHCLLLLAQEHIRSSLQSLGAHPLGSLERHVGRLGHQAALASRLERTQQGPGGCWRGAREKTLGSQRWDCPVSLLTLPTLVRSWDSPSPSLQGGAKQVTGYSCGTCPLWVCLELPVPKSTFLCLTFLGQQIEMSLLLSH